MRATILIIDDLASVRYYHTSFLATKGCNCLSAADGTEAIALMEHASVDLILLDLIMPGMNGDAFVARMGSVSEWSRIPIVVITSERDLAKAVFAGSGRSLCVLEKPVRPNALFSCIENLLAQSTNRGGRASES